MLELAIGRDTAEESAALQDDLPAQHSTAGGQGWVVEDKLRGGLVDDGGLLLGARGADHLRECFAIGEQVIKPETGSES